MFLEGVIYISWIYLLLHYRRGLVLLAFNLADLVVESIKFHALFQLFYCFDGCLPLLSNSSMAAFERLLSRCSRWQQGRCRRWPNWDWEVLPAGWLWGLFYLERVLNINWLCIFNLLAYMQTILPGPPVSLYLVHVVEFKWLHPDLRNIQRIVVIVESVILLKSNWASISIHTRRCLISTLPWSLFYAHSIASNHHISTSKSREVILMVKSLVLQRTVKRWRW